MSSSDLIATASFGLEAVVARELERLGYTEQTVEDGRVVFRGDEAALCRANLWLRSADRVLVRIGSFPARDFGELFEQTKALPWSDWLPEEAAFPVRGKSVRSPLHSVPDVQALVKKAIVESLKRTYQRQWFEETGPLYAVEASVLKDQVTLTIDTTGPGLHKRGYRTLSGPSPLKETLAAGLIQLSYWNAERPLIDPLCGTGTIPIEAALIGRNRAPGLDRTFAAEAWPRVPKRLWDEARTEARETATGRPAFPIVGTDHDEQVLSMARHHARQAGVDGDLHLQRQEFRELTTSRQYGCVICNPPYGQRSGDLPAVEALYRDMGDLLPTWETWSVYVLTAHPQFDSLYGRRADRRRKLYNGRIECTYHQYLGPRPPRRKDEDRESKIEDRAGKPEGDPRSSALDETAGPSDTDGNHSS